MKWAPILFLAFAATSLGQAEDRKLTAEDVERIVDARMEAIKKQVRADLLRELGISESLTKPLIREKPHIVTNDSGAAPPTAPLTTSSSAVRPATARTLLDRGANDAPSGFQLSAGTDASRATIRWANEVSEIEGMTGVFSKNVLSASAPIDKGPQGYTNIATLDGLANSFKLEFNRTRFVLSEMNSPVGSDGTYKPAYLKLCKDAGISDKANCNRSKIEQALHAGNRDDLIPQLDAFFESSLAWRMLYGFNVAVGRDSTDFYDSTSLKKMTTTHVPWSTSAFYGVVPPLDANSMLIGSMEFQHSFQGAKSAVECPLPAMQSHLVCVNGSIGPPLLKEKVLAAVEYRALLFNKAYSIKLTRDIKNNETGVDVPIYLVGNGTGQLNGGVRLGWTNTDHLTLGLFVGNNFDFFSQ